MSKEVELSHIHSPVSFYLKKILKIIFSLKICTNHKITLVPT